MKLRKLYRLIFFLHLLIFAGEINDLPELLIDGTYELTFIKDDPNSTVVWQVDRVEIDELTGNETTFPSVYSTEGDTVKFLFLRSFNKITFYDIIAKENRIKDSIRVQVFSKGSVSMCQYKSENSSVPTVNVFVILPESFNQSSQFLMVMHGTDRNAKEYANVWRNFANKHNYVIAAPKFDDINWDGSLGYNLGNIFRFEEPYTNLRPQEEWGFFVVSQIHNELSRGLEIKKTYSIWGHSAGAQFVHRMMFFLPDPEIELAIAANAGWYTAPDIDIEYPWGLDNIEFSFSDEDLLEYTEKNLIIMRGTADTIRDNNLNTDLLSDQQGKNRFERALYFYNKGLEFDNLLNWQLIDVEGVGHDKEGMASAAENVLLNLTGVEDGRQSLKRSFLLNQNYPNPFNSSTVISFSLSAEFKTTLKVYNILGKHIKTLVNKKLTAGEYRVEFDAGNLASGIYIYQIVSGNFVSSKKMVIVK